MIESILEGNTLERLIDMRVREIMYNSFSGWIDFLNNRGFSIKEEMPIKEMFLIRNVLIHNNKKVGKDLNEVLGGKRYQLNKKVNVTRKDIERFKNSIGTFALNIYAMHSEKLNKKTNTNT